ncbi:hypothetical protein [Riemerella anatipestifer]|nr:hypothetical protein [Riemerella anatipestifer]MDR7798177.1 hypothetical protein [Riemerella anatipestifer]
MEYSFWMFSLLYATLSFIPYYVIFRNNFEVLLDRSFTLNKITLMLLLFLPTPHFWLASFSKDSLCFLLVFTLIYLFNNVKTKYKYLFMIFLFILLLLVRPYVGFILIATFLCTEVLHFKGKVNIRRLYVAFFLSVFSILISIYFIHYSLSVEVNTPWQFIQDSYAVLEGYSSKRSSSSAILSLQNTIFPERLLYILYRPTVFEATSIYQWAVAIENLVLVIYSLLLLFFSRLKAAQPMIMSYGFYGLFTFLFYGLYVFNYGQASRMKANYIIFLLLYLFVAISNKKSLKLNKQNV